MIVLCGPAQFCSGTVGAGQPHLPDSQISSQLAIKCGGEVMGNDFPALGVTWASVAYLSYLIKFIQNHQLSPQCRLAHSYCSDSPPCSPKTKQKQLCNRKARFNVTCSAPLGGTGLVVAALSALGRRPAALLSFSPPHNIGYQTEDKTSPAVSRPGHLPRTSPNRQFSGR